jgi:hypothetical protein
MKMEMGSFTQAVKKLLVLAEIESSPSELRLRLGKKRADKIVHEIFKTAFLL